MENKGGGKLKKKVVALLFSMMLFIGVFLYGAYLNIEKKSEKGGQSKRPNPVESVLENVWIISGQDSEITYFDDGQQLTVKTAMKLSQSIGNVIGDITVRDNVVQKVKLKPDRLSGKVISIDEQNIQLEYDGAVHAYPVSKSFKVYRNKDGLKSLSNEEILVGYDNVEFVLGDDELCAGIVEKDLEIENIRVLIRNSDYKDVLHSQIKFTCTSDYTVKAGKQKSSFKAGKTIIVKPSSKLLSSGRMTIIPKKKSGKIKLLNVNRTCGNPGYRGIMEISKYEDKLTVVNELSMEEYLYAVIPSEMPTDYGAEALKVQAVCARSYAYKQLLQNHFSQYGAHIDDSVASQVYNNIAEDAHSIKAVKDTYGEVMLSDNKLIEAYYFSTSWGCTADAKDVWLSESNEYLEGKMQICKGAEKKVLEFDFSKDTDFKKFLNNKKNKTYDSEFPWYRWNVTLKAKDIKESIDKNLKERYKVNPSLILTLSDGTYQCKPIESIGTVKEIEVGNRTRSGLINELIIKGSDATIKVCSEYNIRLLLAPLHATIKRNDKSRVEGLTMLPSAFFLVTSDKKKATFTFQGGGYGHGVGMSQNGVKAMSESGFNYSSILQHYYSGTTIGNLHLQ